MKKQEEIKKLIQNKTRLLNLALISHVYNKWNKA